jgi:hypothetical protein
MMLRLSNIVETAIAPALSLLPKHLTSDGAVVLLLAIGLQESRFEYRRQLGNGPARGLWQFEQGTTASRGGVTGVYLHRATHEMLRLLCHDRDCNFDPRAIWHRLEDDDVLAAGVARLLLWTDPKPLPALGDADGAWDYYERTWRPGRPKRRTWRSFYGAAMQEMQPS